ncbi:MAG: acyl-CoA dehydratase activase [Desulfatiglans sp.]|jgi:predicted CoA-substrate-specific enzyme activase|nr:acyl-CoA dehydratase activase [Thermodesulfobacteriota bacterium]MEE4351558.1 acyl-CoA dehydratase activase [Desulfatiglans sp.]
MKVGGIDIGSSTAKAVIMDDDEIFYSIQPLRNTWRVEADNILAQVLEKANTKRGDLECLIASGLVGDDWEEADDFLSDVSCAANAAVYLYPSARTVIDMGAESSVVMRCDETGIVMDYRVNQKCGSGSGLFLDVVARALEMDIEHIGETALKSQKSIIMNSTCAVFAESEVVSLIHMGESPSDILMAVLDSIASKIEALMKAVKLEKDVVFLGGVARNTGMVKALSEVLGVPVKVPEAPDIAIALGAAIEARELV